MKIVELENVSKYYNENIGVENISFQIEEGSIVGLIGPNGAGKSTTVKLISGILNNDSGNIEVLGYNPVKDLEKLSKRYGLMFNNRSSLWFNLKAIDSLKLMKSIYGISKSNFDSNLQKYSKILNAEELLEKPVREMSLGQRIKIEILVTLLHDPELLIYDEPTLGLDTFAKKQFRKILGELRENGKTILITTHDLVDVEKIADRIILINNGSKLLDLSREEFTKMIGDRFILSINSKNVPVYLEEYLVETSQSTSRYMIKNDIYKQIIEKVSEKFEPYEYSINKPLLEDLLNEYYRP